MKFTLPGLGSSPKPPPPPEPPPPPPPPAPMPDPEDTVLQANKRRKVAGQAAQSGRMATVLSQGGGGERLGG